MPNKEHCHAVSPDHVVPTHKADLRCTGSRDGRRHRLAATNWVVGLQSGSSGEAQSASISNLAITAVASPSAGNLLYPGGAGDALIKITNPNGFPVTITAVQLPANTSYATGYSDAALSAAVAGCAAGTRAG